MTYEEFLQTPAEFVDDVAKILGLKGKWGLSLTDDERMLLRHLCTLQLKSAVKFAINAVDSAANNIIC
jgi:hypothetical protein